ncbi:MAG TPA: cupin domain-containing protein [Gaiellaceae bacterium]|jgi:uncharacterized cupin superfamily protein|nr:cupin domain-containing protein [Gaiellaceae bacterium]
MAGESDEGESGEDVFAELPEIGDGIRGKRLVREEGRPLAAAVWELPPGSSGVPYHFHHGTEEYLIVLRGTATLRTPQGERELSAGSVAHFSPGREGAHTVMNRGDEPVRYVMVGAHTSPDIVEYLDEGTFAAVAKTLSQRGEPFFVRQELPD